MDFDTDAGLQDHPVVTIYHPRSSKLGHTFANVAWAGKIINIITIVIFNEDSFYNILKKKENR